MEMPEWREIFAPNGHLAKAGDLIRRPNLANTLETIAKEGADAFYKVSGGGDDAFYIHVSASY